MLTRLRVTWVQVREYWTSCSSFCRRYRWSFCLWSNRKPVNSPDTGAQAAIEPEGVPRETTIQIRRVSPVREPCCDNEEPVDFVIV